MKTSFYFSTIAVCVLLLGGCGKESSSASKISDGTSSAPPSSSPKTTSEPTKNQEPKNTPVVQHSEEQEQLAKLDAAVCKVDVTNKVLLVMPWDGKTWKQGPRTILSWEDSTALVKFWHIEKVTMAQFVGGTPLDESIKNISDLKGERVTFYIHKVGDKEVIAKMEIEIAQFAHEPIPALVGSNRVQILVDPGASTKVQCDDGK